MPADHVERVRRCIENYHQVNENLEKISDINRELTRRQKDKARTSRRVFLSSLPRFPALASVLRSAKFLETGSGLP